MNEFYDSLLEPERASVQDVALKYGRPWEDRSSSTHLRQSRASVVAVTSSAPGPAVGTRHGRRLPPGR